MQWGTGAAGAFQRESCLGFQNGEQAVDAAEYLNLTLFGFCESLTLRFGRQLLHAPFVFRGKPKERMRERPQPKTTADSG